MTYCVNTRGSLHVCVLLYCYNVGIIFTVVNQTQVVKTTVTTTSHGDIVEEKSMFVSDNTDRTVTASNVEEGRLRPKETASTSNFGTLGLDIKHQVHFH